jgi:hypothetical protein
MYKVSVAVIALDIMQWIAHVLLELLLHPPVLLLLVPLLLLQPPP